MCNFNGACPMKNECHFGGFCRTGGLNSCLTGGGHYCSQPPCDSYDNTCSNSFGNRTCCSFNNGHNKLEYKGFIAAPKSDCSARKKKRIQKTKCKRSTDNFKKLEKPKQCPFSCLQGCFFIPQEVVNSNLLNCDNPTSSRCVPAAKVLQQNKKKENKTSQQLPLTRKWGQRKKALVKKKLIQKEIIKKEEHSKNISCQSIPWYPFFVPIMINIPPVIHAQNYTATKQLPISRYGVEREYEHSKLQALCDSNHTNNGCEENCTSCPFYYLPQPLTNREIKDLCKREIPSKCINSNVFSDEDSDDTEYFPIYYKAPKCKSHKNSSRKNHHKEDSNTELDKMYLEYLKRIRKYCSSCEPVSEVPSESLIETLIERSSKTLPEREHDVRPFRRKEEERAYSYPSVTRIDRSLLGIDYGMEQFRRKKSSDSKKQEEREPVLSKQNVQPCHSDTTVKPLIEQKDRSNVDLYRTGSISNQKKTLKHWTKTPFHELPGIIKDANIDEKLDGVFEMYDADKQFSGNTTVVGFPIEENEEFCEKSVEETAEKQSVKCYSSRVPSRRVSIDIHPIKIDPSEFSNYGLADTSKEYGLSLGNTNNIDPTSISEVIGQWKDHWDEKLYLPSTESSRHRSLFASNAQPLRISEPTKRTTSGSVSPRKLSRSSKTPTTVAISSLESLASWKTITSSKHFKPAITKTFELLSLKKLHNSVKNPIETLTTTVGVDDQTPLIPESKTSRLVQSKRTSFNDNNLIDNNKKSATSISASIHSPKTGFRYSNSEIPLPKSSKSIRSSDDTHNPKESEISISESIRSQKTSFSYNNLETPATKSTKYKGANIITNNQKEPKPSISALIHSKRKTFSYNNSEIPTTKSSKSNESSIGINIHNESESKISDLIQSKNTSFGAKNLEEPLRKDFELQQSSKDKSFANNFEINSKQISESLTSRTASSRLSNKSANVLMLSKPSLIHIASSTNLIPPLKDLKARPLKYSSGREYESNIFITKNSLRFPPGRQKTYRAYSEFPLKQFNTVQDINFYKSKKINCGCPYPSTYCFNLKRSTISDINRSKFAYVQNCYQTFKNNYIHCIYPCRTEHKALSFPNNLLCHQPCRQTCVCNSCLSNTPIIQKKFSAVNNASFATHPYQRQVTFPATSTHQNVYRTNKKVNLGCIKVLKAFI